MEMEANKNVPLLLYEFLVTPPGFGLTFPLSLIHVVGYRAEDAVRKARETAGENGIVLVGSTDAVGFVEKLGIPAKAVTVAEKPPPDYGSKTAEEIERLCQYLRDNGYKVTKPKPSKA